MNIQLANVLSDVSGVIGQAILEAILAGERDPHKLLRCGQILCNSICGSSYT